MEGDLLHSFVAWCIDRAELGSFPAGIGGYVCRSRRAFRAGPTITKLAAKARSRNFPQIMEATVKQPLATQIGEARRRRIAPSFPSLAKFLN